MNRSLHRLSIAVLLAAALVPAAVAEDALTTQLPADVPFALVLKDVGGLEDRWGASVFGRAGNDPRIVSFMDPFLSAFDNLFDDGEGEERAETDVESDEPEAGSFDKLLPTLSGSAAFLLTDLTALDDESDAGGLLFVAGIGNREQLESVLDEKHGFGPFGISEDEERIKIEREEFLGVELRRFLEIDDEGKTLDSVALALADDRLVIGDEDEVRSQIERMQKGVDTALDDRSALRSLRSHAPAADLVFVVALDSLIGAKRAEAEAQEEEAKRLAEDPEHEMELTGDAPSASAVFEGLGLDAMAGIAIAVTLDPAETALDVVFTYTEERGLMRILSAYRPGPVELPRFIPSSAFEASAANFSMPIAWQGAREMIEGVQPEMGDMIDMQLAQLKEATGIDLERNVFGSLGDTLFVAQFMPESDTPGESAEIDVENIPQVVGFKVDDPDTFDQGFQMLVAFLEQGGPNFRRVEYLDDVFYEVSMPGGAPPENGENGGSSGEKIGFAHAGGHLMLCTGGTEPLRAILAQMAEPGPSIWEQGKVKRAMKRLPEGASAVSASSTFQLGRVFFSAFTKGLAGAIVDEGGQVSDSELPPAEVFAKYFDTAVSGVYRESGELRMTWRLLSGE